MSLGEKSILTISGYEHAPQATEAIFQVLEETRCQMLTFFKHTVTMRMVHGEPTYSPDWITYSTPYTHGRNFPNVIDGSIPAA